MIRPIDTLQYLPFLRVEKLLIFTSCSLYFLPNECSWSMLKYKCKQGKKSSIGKIVKQKIRWFSSPKK